MIIRRKCMCGRVTTVEGKGKSIEELKLNVGIFDRETLISSLCHQCQSNLFNVPLEGDDSFGKFIGYCSICDCKIWKKDSTENGYKCPSCSFNLGKEVDSDGYIEER